MWYLLTWKRWWIDLWINLGTFIGAIKSLMNYYCLPCSLSGALYPMMDQRDASHITTTDVNSMSGYLWTASYRWSSWGMLQPSRQSFLLSHQMCLVGSSDHGPSSFWPKYHSLCIWFTICLSTGLWSISETTLWTNWHTQLMMLLLWFFLSALQSFFSYHGSLSCWSIGPPRSLQGNLIGKFEEKGLDRCPLWMRMVSW